MDSKSIVQNFTHECGMQPACNKKLSYRRGTARRVVSIEILPRNSAETTYTTSPDQIDGMKLEI